MIRGLLVYLRYVRQRDAGALISTLMILLCSLGLLALFYVLNAHYLLWVDNHLAY